MPNPLLNLASPISPDAPSGPEPASARIDHPIQARQVSVEQLLDDLEVRVRAWPPADFGQPAPDEARDWAGLSQLCIAGLGACRHLRLAAYLCICEVEQRGLPGLRDGLDLIAALVDTRWQDVHPGPAAVERQVMRRSQILKAIAGREVASANSDGFFVRLLAQPFESTASPARLLDVSVGFLGWPVPTWVAESERPKEIDAARRRVLDLRVADPEGHARSIETIAGCLAALERIKGTFRREQVEPERTPNMEALGQLLERAAAALSGADEVASGTGAGGKPTGPSDGAPSVQVGAGAGGGGDWRSMSITSMDEVRLALHKVIRYLGANPSNPAMLFLEAGLSVMEKPYPWLMENVDSQCVKALDKIREADKPASPTTP